MKRYEAEPRDEINMHTPATGEEIEGAAGTAYTPEEEFPAAPAPTGSFKRSRREWVLGWLPFWGVLLLAGVLRFWALGDKPLHHDESLHAYFSLQLLHNNIQNWLSCFSQYNSCYRYDPLLHGPFQFHFIALTYQLSQWLGAADQGVNTTTVRILAATLGTALVGLPYFLRDYLGKLGAWLACFVLAVSPSMAYFSRFAREDIYFAFFTALLVVATARYLRDRTLRWLVIGALAFAFAYATKEATFLVVAIFGSFLGALVAWELGLKLPLRSLVGEDAPLAAYLPRTLAPAFLLVYIVVTGVIGLVFLRWLEALSVTITKNQAAADAYVQGLKDKTVAVVPWLGIALGVLVLVILARELFGHLPPPGRRGLARRIDPREQRVLDMLVTMPWTHWFFAVLAAWTVFLVLFTALFTNIKGGIGDGIWQGIYYWTEQQQVARGGQPWYYYLLLIPLYEQLGVVFGLVGLVRCVLRPTRFRLFVVFWLVGNLFIYSWAAEKMPWLMIHIMLPLLLLAALGLEPLVLTLANFVKNLLARPAVSSMPAGEHSPMPLLAPSRRPRVGGLRAGAALLGLLAAVALLIPTLYNMYQVTYIHPADGPHEMMVYVQTTTDVNKVMAKVDALDKQLDGGTHQLAVGVMNDAVWPFIWYLRDYPNVCLDYPTGCPATAKSIPVIISGGDNLYSSEAQYGDSKNSTYVYHQYHMRTWWDEGYKPPPCVQTRTNNCNGQPAWGGVGPWLWLSYGDNPPPGAKFNFGLAAQRVWQWWWHRQPFGATDGSYDMALFIRKDLGVNP